MTFHTPQARAIRRRQLQATPSAIDAPMKGTTVIDEDSIQAEQDRRNFEAERREERRMREYETEHPESEEVCEGTEEKA